MILVSNITASSQEADSNSFRGTCDEANFDMLMDEQDHEAR